MIDTITASPLFGLVLTIFAFLFGRAVQRKTGWTLANPLVIATVLCVSVLLLFDILTKTTPKAATSST
jgi:putative effector of murein hydrolase